VYDIRAVRAETPRGCRVKDNTSPGSNCEATQGAGIARSPALRKCLSGQEKTAAGDLWVLVPVTTRCGCWDALPPTDHVGRVCEAEYGSRYPPTPPVVRMVLILKGLQKGMLEVVENKGRLCTTIIDGIEMEMEPPPPYFCKC
jgi:hypothetical protein